MSHFHTVLPRLDELVMLMPDVVHISSSYSETLGESQWMENFEDLHRETLSPGDDANGCWEKFSFTLWLGEI